MSSAPKRFRESDANCDPNAPVVQSDLDSLFASISANVDTGFSTMRNEMQELILRPIPNRLNTIEGNVDERFRQTAERAVRQDERAAATEALVQQQGERLAQMQQAIEAM